MSFRTIITWISIIGSIASIIALIYIFYPLRDKINLEVITLSCDNLTKLNNTSEPEIKANFEYKGKNINNLWRINLLVRNTSNKTLIGLGEQKSLIKDTLYFMVRKGYSIIDSKLVKSDFSHKLSIKGYDTIMLNFSQWRFNEIIEYIFYITSDNDSLDMIHIFSQPDERQIIDGDIVFSKYEEKPKNALITDIFTKPIKKIAYVIFIIYLGLFVILIFAMVIVNPIGFSKRKKWYSNYGELFKMHLNKEFNNNHLKANEFYKEPQKYRNWHNFKGAKFPDDLTFDFGINGSFNFLLTEIFILVLLFVQIIISIDLIQLFP